MSNDMVKIVGNLVDESWHLPHSIVSLNEKLQFCQISQKKKTEFEGQESIPTISGKEVNLPYVLIANEQPNTNERSSENKHEACEEEKKSTLFIVENKDKYSPTTKMPPNSLPTSFISGDLAKTINKQSLEIAEEIELNQADDCDCNDANADDVDADVRKISRSEVTHHADYSSCWIIVNQRVYDVTSFMRQHPGGEEIILEHAGWDATMSFKDVGHSKDAQEILETYFIGIVDEDSTRRFRNDTV